MVLAAATVLVVDDAPMIREIIVLQLNALGISKVETAGSAEEALRVLAYKRFNLILSDWSMSGMTGLELLIRLRADEKIGKTPFVLITGEMQREMVSQAIQAGVNDFLLKPFKPEEFERKVESAILGRISRNLQPVSSAECVVAPPREKQLATVLLVDDTPENLILASRLLRDKYQVKMAANGEKALQLCKSSPPDLVLLDVMMPGMDGFEVCRRLKADVDTAHIPVIFLTALDDVAKTVEGFALGAVDYIGKPFEPAILQSRVATALRVSRAREELRESYDLAIENARLREDVERIARHDLKNPLSAIIGLAAALQGQPNLTPQQNQQSKAIERAAYDMLDLIHCSGELFKMEQGNYCQEKQAVDLAGVIGRVADETLAAFSWKKIDILVEVPAADGSDEAVIQGDSLLLYSMLHNLVKNAAEAVGSGGEVRIKLEFGDDCLINVHNSGCVPEEIRDRFFDKFATSGKKNGSGLGTYSAKLIAEAHGGSISMETSEEKGTTVSVGLPR